MSGVRGARWFSVYTTCFRDGRFPNNMGGDLVLLFGYLLTRRWDLEKPDAHYSALSELLGRRFFLSLTMTWAALAPRSYYDYVDSNA